MLNSLHLLHSYPGENHSVKWWHFSWNLIKYKISWNFMNIWRIFFFMKNISWNFMKFYDISWKMSSLHGMKFHEHLTDFFLHEKCFMKFHEIYDISWNFMKNFITSRNDFRQGMSVIDAVRKKNPSNVHKNFMNFHQLEVHEISVSTGLHHVRLVILIRWVLMALCTSTAWDKTYLS
jgi:hypothetical protein